MMNDSILKANQVFFIEHSLNYSKRVWINTRFAIIIFLLLFFILGGINLTMPSIVVLITLLVAFFSLQKKAVIYIQKIYSDTENLSVEYQDKDESKKITIPIKSAVIRKEREKTKAQGHYILKILNQDEHLLIQYNLLSWDEVNMDKVIQVFYNTNIR